jgi:uncharacterized membrane protein YedE/YeeE
MVEPNLLGGFVGGMLIGGAAVLLLLWNGRIAGVSGILGGLLATTSGGGRVWRLAFLAGLPSGAAMYRFYAGALTVELQAGAALLVFSGLLVGIGTGMSSGCTSGHGVCGLARLSPRSLAATGTFMVSGILTVYLVGVLSR